MGRKRKTNGAQLDLLGGTEPRKKPRKQRAPRKAKERVERYVKDGYRPRTRKLKVGQSRVKEGAIDPSTGRRKKYEIRRVE